MKQYISELMKGEWGLTGSMLCRIGIAAILGGLIGLEREKANQTAGLRTHILICLGAVLVMCTGEHIFEVYSGKSSIDPARLGAQVVSGIGVLCAGTIMKEGSTIKGLTTATGLWCSACIGLAVGSGNVIPAVVVTLIALAVLHLLRYLENRDGRKQTSACLKITLENGVAVERATMWLWERQYMTELLRLERCATGSVILYCSLKAMNPQQRLEMMVELSRLEGIEVVVTQTGEEAS